MRILYLIFRGFFFVAECRELRCFQEIGEERRAEEEQRIEREKASVELLQTMVSQIVETNRRISELNVQLSAVGAAVENSDSNAAEGHKHAIRLGTATLIATGIGIAVPFVFFWSASSNPPVRN